MGRKKILYVVTKSVWGGAQRYVFDLATNLPKERFEIAVVTGGKGPFVEKLNLAGIRTIVLPALQEDRALFKVLFSFINFRALFQLIRILRKERPDIVHLNSSKIGGLGAVAARIVPMVNGQMSKVVFTVHGWGFKEARPWISRLLIFFISWVSSLFQDKIILISTADFRAAQKFIPPKKLALIFNGMEPVDFLPREEAREFFAEKIGRKILEDTILIGTIAELTKNKDVSNLISALSRLSRRNLDSNYRGFASIVIGEGKERSKLQAQIAELGLTDTVFLPGFLADAARYLKAFDLFVLPSLKEGLPYTIMEAMAAGLYIVATNVGGIPDLIHDGESGLLVHPKDPKSLALTIEALLKNPARRVQLGQAAENVAKTKFALRAMIEKTIALYGGKDS